MAIPTDFKGFVPNATVTKTFKILGSATVGLWACDVDGTLSANTAMVPLAPNMVLLFDQAYTVAQIDQALKDYLKLRGALPEGGAGGRPVGPDQQVAVTAQTTA